MRFNQGMHSGIHRMAIVTFVFGCKLIHQYRFVEAIKFVWRMVRSVGLDLSMNAYLIYIVGVGFKRTVIRIVIYGCGVGVT